jgi:hypothetical protein
MGTTKDPLSYDESKDLAMIAVPKDIPSPKQLGDVEAECKRVEMAGLIQPIDTNSLVNPDGTLIRPRCRIPTFQECEILGRLVAFGLTLESACYLLTPPLKYEKVANCFATNYKRRIIYQRAQSVWLYGALQQLLTRPAGEICGLIFILKNRHSKMFGASSKMHLDVDVSPLQLTSPEVIQRARLYAQTIPSQVIDVDATLALPLTASIVDKNTNTPPPSSPEVTFTTASNFYETKEQKDQRRAKEYFEGLTSGAFGDATDK